MTDHQPTLNPHDFPGKDIYAVVGNPIEHSKSPVIQAEFARQNSDTDFYYGKIWAPLDGFQAVAQEFFVRGGKGLNVTVPFKLEAFEMAVVRSEAAQIAQAANVLYVHEGQLHADNTDGYGLCSDLSRILQGVGRGLLGARVLILGAGGAAQGVISPLNHAQVKSIAMWNRTGSKVQQLKDIFPVIEPLATKDLSNQPPFDLIINATASGLIDASPIEKTTLQSIADRNTVIYDMVYGKQTPFMKDAMTIGLHAFDGLGMLVEQAAQSYRIWRGQQARIDIEKTIQVVRSSY